MAPGDGREVIGDGDEVLVAGGDVIGREREVPVKVEVAFKVIDVDAGEL